MPRKNKKTPKRVSLSVVFPWLLIVTAVVGLGASFVLILEHMALLKDPAHNLNCNLNPILSCGPVMQSETASFFGFPNPLIGLASFSAQALLGVVILAGAKLKSWFWKLWLVQVTAAVAFMLFLIHQSIFEIKAICIYCMAVWIVLSISAWYSFVFALREKAIVLPNSRITQIVNKFHLEIIISWFVILAGLILYEFWYYFGPKLGL